MNVSICHPWNRPYSAGIDFIRFLKRTHIGCFHHLNDAVFISTFVTMVWLNRLVRAFFLHAEIEHRIPEQIHDWFDRCPSIPRQ